MLPLSPLEIKTTLRQVIRREADSLFLYQLPDREAILHIEIQQEDQPTFSARNHLYLSLLLNQYPDREIIQYVLYTGKKPPVHVGRALESGRFSYSYHVIYLAGMSLENFTGLQSALAYTFAAGAVKNESELKEFLDNFVEKAGDRETENFDLSLLVIEGLLEKTPIKIFDDMINLKSPKKSKILGSILRREEAARREEKLKTAEKCLLEGLDLKTTVKITGLTLSEVEAIARRLGLM